VPKPETPVLIGRPVAFVRVALEGVPRSGVTSAGEVANTAEPVPVSSVKAPAKLADVNEPSTVALPVEVTAPVRLAFVVTLPAVKPAAVPVMLVPIRAEGVPRSGVTNVGEVARTLLPVPVLVTLTTFLLASSAKAVEAVRLDRVVVPLTVTLVNEAEPPALLTLMKSVPFHATTADSPLTMVTPVVGPTPRNTMDCVPPEELITV
jgi:hypothetical protein